MRRAAASLAYLEHKRRALDVSPDDDRESLKATGSYLEVWIRHRLVLFGLVDVEDGALPRAGRHNPDRYRARPTRQIKIDDERCCENLSSCIDLLWQGRCQTRLHTFDRQKIVTLSHPEMLF